MNGSEVSSREQLDELYRSGKIGESEYATLRAALNPPKPPAPAPEGVPVVARRLTKSWKVRWLGGVCGGLAQYLGIPPILTRLLFAIAFFAVHGVALLVYLLFYFALPWDDPEAAYEPSRKGHPWLFALGTALLFVTLPYLFAQGIDLTAPHTDTSGHGQVSFLAEMARDLGRQYFDEWASIFLMSIGVGFLTLVYLVIHTRWLRRAYTALILALGGAWLALFASGYVAALLD